MQTDHPVLNSSRCYCVKWGIICEIEIRPVFNLQSDNEDETNKINEGEYYPAYSYIIKENINVGLRMHLSVVRLLNLMGTLWTLLYLLKYHRGLRVVTVEKCATLGVRFNILH